MGAASFPVLYYYEKSAYADTPITYPRITLSYGIPITVLIFGSIFLITFYSFKKIFINISYYQIDFLKELGSPLFCIVNFTKR